MKNPPRFSRRHAFAVISLTLTPLAMGQAPVNNYIWYNVDPELGPLNGNWHIQPTGDDPVPPPIWVLNNEPAVGVPDTQDDTATIDNGATVTLNQETVDVSRISVAGAGESKLIFAGDISSFTRQLLIGVNQVGTVDITSGEVILADQGLVAGSLAPSITIGQEASGTGVLNQSGGLLNASAITSGGGHEDLRIGAFGGTGTYNLSGGEATIYNLRLGFAGATAGVINHSGGTLTHAGGDFAISWAASTGVYNLSGSAVLNVSPGRVRIGATGTQTGHFNQTGGTGNISARFEIGTEGAAQGFYDISGGTMTINEDIMVGAFNAGTTGTLTQTGGTLTAGRVRVGVEASTVGHMYLNGGTLITREVFKEHATATGTLDFNGGTISPAINQNGNFIRNFAQVGVLAGGIIVDTAGRGISINPPLVGPGGLTKKGAQDLNLSALSDYEGNTVIEQGQLKINFPGGLNPTSSVIVAASGAEFNLAYTGSNTVAALIIGGTPVAAGTYGSVEVPSPGVTPLGLLKGTGTLIVTPPPVAGYTAWSEDPANNLAVGERGPTLDPDNDGFTNLNEYFLGGQPKVSSRVIAPVASLTATDINFAFNRSVASGTDTTAVIQWSTDLTTWPPANDIPVSGTGAINQTIPRSNAVNGKLFTRLKVLKP